MKTFVAARPAASRFRLRPALKEPVAAGKRHGRRRLSGAALAAAEAGLFWRHKSEQALIEQGRRAPAGRPVDDRDASLAPAASIEAIMDLLSAQCGWSGPTRSRQRKREFRATLRKVHPHRAPTITHGPCVSSDEGQ